MSNRLTVTVDDCVSWHLENEPTFSFENKTRLSALDGDGALSRRSPFSATSTIFGTSAFSQTSIKVLNVFCQIADLVVSLQLSASPAQHPAVRPARCPAIRPSIHPAGPALPCPELATRRSHQG